MIYNSVKFLKDNDSKVVFDAEHFFDGYKDDSEFALKMLLAAEKAGADILVLCDTNGGSLPNEIFEIVTNVKSKVKLTYRYSCP